MMDEQIMAGGKDGCIGREERWWDGWDNKKWRRREKGLRNYLEIICNKTVDDRIHTAIQTAESDSQVVYYHMMRHIWVEIHHHLQHEKSSHIMLLQDT